MVRNPALRSRRAAWPARQQDHHHRRVRRLHGGGVERQYLVLARPGSWHPEQDRVAAGLDRGVHQVQCVKGPVCQGSVDRQVPGLPRCADEEGADRLCRRTRRLVVPGLPVVGD